MSVCNAHIKFYTEQDMFTFLANALEDNKYNVQKVDDDNYEVDVKVDEEALKDLYEIKCMEYHGESFIKNFVNCIKKDTLGNILYESHSDGYTEENKYTKSGNKYYCRTQYSNGVVELEQWNVE